MAKPTEPGLYWLSYLDTTGCFVYMVANVSLCRDRYGDTRLVYEVPQLKRFGRLVYSSELVWWFGGKLPDYMHDCIGVGNA